MDNVCGICVDVVMVMTFIKINGFNEVLKTLLVPVHFNIIRRCEVVSEKCMKVTHALHPVGGSLPSILYCKGFIFCKPHLITSNSGIGTYWTYYDGRWSISGRHTWGAGTVGLFMGRQRAVMGANSHPGLVGNADFPDSVGVSAPKVQFERLLAKG